jgi:phage terminase small subunit
MSSQLTELERKFVDYIVAGEKHIDAVLKAGYSCTKRSYASTLGANILKRSHVQEYLAKRRAEAAERNAVVQDLL